VLTAAHVGYGKLEYVSDIQLSTSQFHLKVMSKIKARQKGGG
jgi:hypothetical protein